MDSHTTKNSTSLSVPGSILKDFWEPMSVGVKVILLVEDDKTLYIPCRVGNSWGSHVQDGYKCINEKMDSHITKIRWAFRHSVSFWKIFGNRCRSMWGSYSWLRTTRLYTTSCRVGNSLGLPCVCTWWLQAYQQKDGLSHYQKFDKLFSIWFHFKRFLGTDVSRCEGHTLGWGWSGKKFGFDTLSNHNWVIRLGLEIHPNGRGKIGILTLCRIAIG